MPNRAASVSMLGSTSNYVDKTEKDFFERIKNIQCSDIEFLKSLLQHIPNKYSHMVYYYGIFANRTKSKYINTI
ncbi:MAG: transposase, partial [Candidatus Peribacteria bacterium]|nr:transposase [Candidatus Peribacteria bacterium]